LRRFLPSCAVLAASLLLIVSAAAAVTDRDHVITPADYFTINGVYEIAISPDGGTVAYVEARWQGPDEKRRTDLWVVPAGGGDPARLSFDRQGCGSLAWGSDGNIFLKARDKRGEETPPHDGSSQVWRVDPSSGDWLAGGFLTNCVITAAPQMFKAASSGAGVLDQVIQWGTEDTPGHVINYMQGLPWEKPEAYRDGSPIFSLGDVKTPTLIHQGGDDPRVPPAHARGLYRALRHYLDVPCELVIYPGEGHSPTTYDHRLAKMKWDLAWFGKYLPVDGEVSE